MSARFRGGPTLAIAYCALIWALGASPARSQDSCPVPDPGVTLEAKWMVDRVCACASLQPGDPACECEKRKYIATIVSGLETQGVRRRESTPTLDLSGVRQMPTVTTEPSVTSVPTAVPTEHPHPSATPSAQPRWWLFMPRATKGRK